MKRDATTITSVKPESHVIYCFYISDTIGVNSFYQIRKDCKKQCKQHQKCANAIVMDNIDRQKKSLERKIIELCEEH